MMCYACGSGKDLVDCRFMDRLYLLADKEKQEKFIQSPKLYLLPPNPKVPVRLAIFGAPGCGRSSLAYVFHDLRGYKVLIFSPLDLAESALLQILRKITDVVFFQNSDFQKVFSYVNVLAECDSRSAKMAYNPQIIGVPHFLVRVVIVPLNVTSRELSVQIIQCDGLFLLWRIFCGYQDHSVLDVAFSTRFGLISGDILVIGRERLVGSSDY